MTSSLAKFVGALFLVLFALLLINHQTTTLRVGAEHHEPDELLMMGDYGMYNTNYDYQEPSQAVRSAGSRARKNTSSAMQQELQGFNPKVH